MSSWRKQKIQHIIQPYADRLISPFHQSTSPVNVSKEGHIPYSDDQCGHIPYGSSNKFIHHILWYLRPNVFKMRSECSNHSKVSSIERRLNDPDFNLIFWSLLNMCTKCTNMLLSTVHFCDIINFYSISRREYHSLACCWILGIFVISPYRLFIKHFYRKNRHYQCTIK